MSSFECKNCLSPDKKTCWGTTEDDKDCLGSWAHEEKRLPCKCHPDEDENTQCDVCFKTCSICYKRMRPNGACPRCNGDYTYGQFQSNSDCE